MTFFETELRKIVGAVCPDVRYIGRAAYVDIGGENIAKFEFVIGRYADHYSGMKAAVLMRDGGVIDSVTLRFEDLLHDPAIHAWTNDGKTCWYGERPNRTDYDALRSSVSDYIELFSIQPPEVQQDMSMTL